MDQLVHVVQAALPVPLVPRDSREFAVKLVSPAQLAPLEAADREVFLVFLAKMVKLEKMVNLDLPVPLAPLALEAYLECPVCPV